MKRKLIDYEVFEKMRENSLSTAVKELVEVEDHLAHALGADELKLSSFNESSCIYETADGTYLRGNYSIGNGNIDFEDIEELVIDEETEKKVARNTIGELLEAILDDNDVHANELFGKYMGVASGRYKREGATDDSLEEGYARLYGTRGKGGRPKLFSRSGAKNPVKSRAARLGHSRHRASYYAGGRKRHRNLPGERRRRKGYKKEYGRLSALSGGRQYTGKRKKMEEWTSLTGNIFNYIDYVDNGHVITEAKVHTGNDGLISVSVPTTKVRNEGKILKMQFDLLKTDLKVLREHARRLVRDQKFCQSVADIKRYNNLSDNEALEESIGNLVSAFPSVLYMTQEELAHTVAQALDSLGVTNYDDQTCTFMAEGILRVAHDAYSDRVDRIFNASGHKSDLKESDDKYIDFQQIVRQFFPTLDESTELEVKVFEDLYNAIVDIRRVALESENEQVCTEAAEFLVELDSVLNGQQMPSLELAADAANWIEDLVEANIPGASDKWTVQKSGFYKTTSGEHPQMAKNAKVGAVPGSYEGDWGDPAPMIGQDSNSWGHGDEARKRSWGNKGGKDVWPDLKNPYIPNPFGDYTMKGEKGADKDGENDWSRYQSSDTWPTLQNPYIPKAQIPKQKVDTSADARLDGKE